MTARIAAWDLSVVAGVAGLATMALLVPGSGRIPDVEKLILCSTPAATPSGAVVTTLRSELLSGTPNKRVTTQLVRFPPGASSPSHVHGGDLTVFVVKGAVRSEHAGLPLAAFHAGETFHEPQGTVHVFIENPSATEWAELLAVMVHDDGAALTTFLD